MGIVVVMTSSLHTSVKSRIRVIAIVATNITVNTAISRPVSHTAMTDITVAMINIENTINTGKVNNMVITNHMPITSTNTIISMYVAIMGMAIVILTM